jgi:hypothetical protein
MVLTSGKFHITFPMDKSTGFLSSLPPKNKKKSIALTVEAPG